MTSDKNHPGALLEPIRNAPPDAPFVVAQLGQSLDGRVATLTGASRSINGPCALDHLHRLRANVDAVVVGIGTVLADDPQLTVRRVEGPQPTRVVIDPHGRLPQSARCLALGEKPCLVVTNRARPLPRGAEALMMKASDEHIPPAHIVGALFDRGLKKILVEGGAFTVSNFIDAGVVDRLHILVGPVILGSGVTGLSLSPISELHQALQPKTTAHVLDGGDVLFDCDLRQRRG
jgi:riboflavin-specific deaminase-like protein